MRKAAQSRVVNYKTEQGQHLTKLSAGDPYKQYRLIEEHQKQRLLAPEKVAIEPAADSRTTNAAVQPRPAALKTVRSTNSDIIDEIIEVVEKQEVRVDSGSGGPQRPGFDLNELNLNTDVFDQKFEFDESTFQAPTEIDAPAGLERIRYGLEEIKVGVNPSYLHG